jgi:hypothetical protein
MASHRVYYKGEGSGFPQVRAVVSLVCPCCPWFILAPRVLQLCTNHFVWVVCKPMWVSEACQLFLILSRSSNTPLYPSKCCELGSVLRLLLLPLFFTWAHIWALWGVGSASSNLKVQLVSIICLLISWNIYSIYIIMLLGITNRFCGIIGYMDTSTFGNHAQLILHCAFSFLFRLSGGFSICISYIVWTKNCCGLVPLPNQ